MMIRISRYFLFLIFLSILISCQNKLFTEEDDGGVVELSLNSKFKICLKGNHDKGFEWRTVGLNRSIVNQVGEPKILTAEETGEKEGTFTFTFQTVGAGHIVLELIYFNKRIEDPEPERCFRIRIVSGMIG